MTRTVLTAALSLLLLGACASQPPAASQADEATPAMQAATHAANTAALDEAIAGSWRTPAFTARDAHRHPKETLTFFGVRPDQTVIEITPGGGWYTEVLAPYLRGNGRYVAAVWDDAIVGQPKYRYGLNKTLREKIAGNAAQYDATDVRVFDPKAPVFGAAASADVVLTFRNAHNWVDEGTEKAYFKAFFDVLKPGGTLGVVDHRAKPGTALEKMKSSGYLTEALVIELAQGAGFVLDARSEVNANPRDTTDHPNGVWTLPPSKQHEKADDAKYQAIGESDRMTLRFIKPRG